MANMSVPLPPWPMTICASVPPMFAIWVVPYDALVAFAEWVAQMVWWFETIPL